MDALDVAVLALRLALVLVLYAFLVVVVRAATRELRAPPTPLESQRRASPMPAELARRGARETAPPGRGQPAAVVPDTPRGDGRAIRLRLLVLEAGESELVPGAELQLADGATLGRSDSSSVVVADPAVSAEHLRLTRVRNQWLATDLGSTNGTLLNHKLVDGDVVLEPGDVLALGNVRLKVVSH